MRILACMNCGSRDLRPANAGEGAIPGVSELSGNRYHCNRCGHVGTPLVFKTEKERTGYAKSRAK